MKEKHSRLFTIARLWLAGLASVAVAQSSSFGAGAASTNGLAPVWAITGKDLPEPEPGKPAWAEGNQWSYAAVFFDKWVYTASTAEYVLQFERNPVTAEIKYVAAFPFNHHDPERGVGVNLTVRRLEDGQALLYLGYGSHGPPLLAWYAIDPRSGALTQKGKVCPAKIGLGALTPDHKRHYLMTGLTTLVWAGFGEDGAPVEEGRIDTRASNHHGPLVLSPDGRHVYMINEDTVQVDAYACDAASGKASYVATLDLKPQLKMASGLLPFSPDGRRLYVFNKNATDKTSTNDQYCVLSRDSDTGALAILSNGTVEPELAGLGGPAWSRGSRFAFNADGQSGYFLSIYSYYNRPFWFGRFECDPKTGALHVTEKFWARGNFLSRFALDPVAGNLVAVGPGIWSYKTPAAGRTDER